MQENVKISIQAGDSGTIDAMTAKAQKLHTILEKVVATAASIRIPTAVAQAREEVAASQGLTPRVRPKSSAVAAAAGPSGTASDTNLSRGISGQTGASGRDFAAQAQGLGGLVHVYATFAANLYAVSAAFGALSKAMDLSNMVKGLDQLGAASGRSLGGLAKQMVLVADGAISMRDAMNSTALASAGGMSNANILRMTEVAKKASLALGRDLPDSMDRLTKGIVKTQPELLDELGIMTRVIPAQEAYARQLGKSASSLTEFEKKQAFANAVLAEGERKFSAIDLDANPYSKILASMSNLMQTGLELVNKVLSPVLTLLSTSPTALAGAMAAIGAILLKQAIPAIGMFREQAQRMQTETTARVKQQILEQQLAAGELDDIARKSAVNRVNIERQGSKQLLDIQKVGTRLSSKVIGQEVKGLLKKSPIDLSKDEQDAIEYKHKELQQKVDKNAATAAEKSAAGLLGQRVKYNQDLLKAQTEAGQAAIDQRVKEDQGILSHERLRQSQLESLRKAEAKAAVLASAADNAAVMGPVYAWKQLKLETDKLDAGPITKFFTKAQGGASILTTAIGNIISVYGIWAMAAGAVYAVLDKYLSKNAKEMEALAQSSSQLDSALENVNSTMRSIITNKDPLRYISEEALSARANALQTVVEQMADFAKRTKEAIEAQSGWDKAKNNIMGLFNSSVQDDAAAGLAKSISSAFKIATTGPERDAAAEAMKKLLGAEIDPSSLTAMKQALNADNYEKFAERANKILTGMSTALSNAASNVKKLNDDFASASKAFDDIILSLQPTDNVAKLGFALIKVAGDFDDGLKKPADAIKQIADTSKDMSKLKLLDPEFAELLMEGSDELNKMADRYSLLSKEIEQASQKQAEYDAKIVETNKKLEETNSIWMSIFSPGPQAQEQFRLKKELDELKKAKAELNQTTPRQQAEVSQIEGKFKSITAQFADQQFSVLARGALLVETSLENALAKGAISLQKVYAEGLAGTIRGLEVNAKLDKDAIKIDMGQIKAQIGLIDATDNLRKVQEKVLLETLQSRAPGLKGEESVDNSKRIDKQKRIIAANELIKPNIGIGDLTDIMSGKGKKFEELLTNVMAVTTGGNVRGDYDKKTATQAIQEAAKALIPKVTATASAQNQLKAKEMEAKAVDVKLDFAKIDLKAEQRKDILDVDEERLAIAKAGLDVQAKSAVFVNKSLVQAQILNENEKASYELKKQNVDFEARIQKAGNDQIAIGEIREQQARNTAKYNAEVKAKAIMDAERLTAATKAQLDLEIKIFDIKNATINLRDNTDLTVQENILSLAKELNVLNAEKMADNEGILAQNREELRSREALQAIESNIKLENSDYDKRLADLKASGGNADALKNLGDLHDANIKKLEQEKASEEKINSVKKDTLDIQKQANVANGKIADKVKLLEHEKALTQDIFEINQQRMDLEDQKLESAKQLNRVSMEYYNAKKAELALAKAQRNFDNDTSGLQKEIALAKEKLEAATEARKAFRAVEAAQAYEKEKGSGYKTVQDTSTGTVLDSQTISRPKASTEETEAEKEAKRALELLNSRFNKLVEILGIQKAQTKETKYLNEETQKTNRLMKEQADKLQSMQISNSVKNAQFDLDSQRLDNAKALNRVSEESYIIEKGAIALDKLSLQYQSDKLAAANDLTLALRAQAEIQKQIDDAKNFEDFNDTGATYDKVVPDQQAVEDADRAVSLAQQKSSAVSSIYEKQKLQTQEGVKQSLELEKQNQLLKAQESLATNLTTLFGDLGTAMGDYLKATIESGKAQKDLLAQKEKELEILKKQPRDDYDTGATEAYEKDKTDIEKKYARLSFEEDVKVTGLKSKYAKKFFNEKSDMYKLLSTIEKTSAAISVAMEFKKVAASIAASGPFVVSKIPGIFASFMEQLGPWGIAAAGIALTAVGLSGSGPEYQPPDVEQEQTVLGTGQSYDASTKKMVNNGGGIPGDPTHVSTSIADGIARLSKIAYDTLDFQKSDTLRALEGIRDNTEGFANYIASSGISADPGLTATKGDNQQWGSPNSILGGLFGGGSSSANTTSMGIKVGGSIADLAAGGGNKSTYKNTRVQGSESALWGLYSKSWDYNIAETGKLQNAKFDEYLSNQAKSFTASVRAVTEAMGGSLEAADNVLKTSTISLTVDTLNLTPEQQAASILAQYGTQMDIILGKAIPQLSSLANGWKKTTESLTDFALRTVDTTKNTTLAFNSIGKSFDAVPEISKTVRHEAQTFTGLLGGVFNWFGGSLFKFITAAWDEKVVTQIARTKEELALMLDKAFGGQDNLNALTKKFADNYLTAAEKLAPVKTAVDNEMKRLGYSYISNKEQFKQLVMGFKVTDQASADAYAALLKVSDAFAQVHEDAMLAKVTLSSTDLFNSKIQQQIKVYDLLGKSEESITAARQTELNAMDERLKPMQKYIYALQDEAAAKTKVQTAYDKLKASITKTIDGLKAGITSLQNYKEALQIGPNANLTPEEAYAAARSKVETTAAVAQQKLGTEASAADIAARDKAIQALPGVFDNFLKESKVSFASGEKYQQDYSWVNNLLDTTTQSLELQQTDAEKLQASTDQSVQYLSNINDSIQTTNDLQNQLLLAQGDYYLASIADVKLKPGDLDQQFATLTAASLTASPDLIQTIATSGAATTQQITDALNNNTNTTVVGLTTASEALTNTFTSVGVTLSNSFISLDSSLTTSLSSVTAAVNSQTAAQNKVNELMIALNDVTGKLTSVSASASNTASGLAQANQSNAALSAQLAEMQKQITQLNARPIYEAPVFTGGRSCFVAGTKVLLADGSLINIEDVKTGDLLVGETTVNTVIEYDYAIVGNSRNCTVYGFNGRGRYVTAEHPLKTKQGWKSIDPEMTYALEPQISNLIVGSIQVGDELQTEDGFILIESIEVYSDESPDTPVYNFMLDGDHTYYVDGILVHNKGGDGGGFAEGGYASAGINLVGEKGPELVDFKTPGRVYTANQTSALMDQSSLVGELKSLREEVSKLRQEQKDQTGQIIISNYDANKKNAEVVASTTESVAKQQEWKERSKVVIV